VPARAASHPPAVAVSPTVTVYTVHPDVRSGPVGVERAQDDFRRGRPRDDSSAEASDRGTAPAARADADAPPPVDEEAHARLLARFRQAIQRRDALAARVSALRSRTDVPVIKDVDDYQRLQADLAAAQDQLDRAEAEVARLRQAVVAGR